MSPIKNFFPRQIRSLLFRHNRRLLTFSSICFLLASLIALVAGKNTTLALIMLFNSAIMGLLLQIATRNLSNSTDLITDERERKLRDHAHRIAYWVMAGVLGGIAGGIMGYFSTRSATTPVLVVADLSKLETLLMLAIFTGVFMGLPTWIIAWLEPDLLEEDNA
jgi:phage shock protein PspC (stress-responsive transcriptional regulator)